MTNLVDFLKPNPLFQGIADEDIQAILTCFGGNTKTYKKGEYVKNQGDPAGFLGIVLQGHLHILQDDYLGNRNIISDVAEGELFAEAFACAGFPSLPVDVYAAAPSTVLFLDADRLLTGCESACSFHHQIMQNLLKILSRKNVTVNQRMKYLSCRTTKDKLLGYLNDRSKLHHSKEFSIPFNRQELADFLCVERSAMSYQMSLLVKEGLIETKKNHFLLHF